MALPIKVIVMIAIAALVLIVITYFLLSSGVFYDKAKLEQQFASGCAAICSNPDRQKLNLGRDYPQWLDACGKLYGVERGAYAVCLDYCGGGCSTRGDACEYLRSFRPVLDNWLEFCNKIKTHPATQPAYGSCSC